MNSYQKRKQEIKELEAQVKELKDTLYDESKTFYSQVQWLGAGHLTTGVVSNGKLIEIHRQEFQPLSFADNKIKIE